MAYGDINVGDSITGECTISDDMVRDFAKLSGDYNPIHVDDEFAKKSLFKNRIAHGLLTIAASSPYFFELCGYNYVLVNIDLAFLKPVYIGETFSTTVRILEKLEKQRLKVDIEASVGERIVGKGTLIAQYIG
ncbi:MAG: MaoC family dehydratase [Candidatus Nanoarchaeia archaeon]